VSALLLCIVGERSALIEDRFGGALAGLIRERGCTRHDNKKNAARLTSGSFEKTNDEKRIDQRRAAQAKSQHPPQGRRSASSR
jgi:hypothetical protein